MKISEYIEKMLERQGRTKLWLAELLGVNYKTLVDRIKNDRLTAYDLLKISSYLSINVEEIKGVISLTKFKVDEASQIVSYVEVEQENGIYEFEKKHHPANNVQEFLADIHNYIDDDGLITKLNHLSKNEAKTIYDNCIKVINNAPLRNDSNEDINDSRENRKNAIREFFEDILE